MGEVARPPEPVKAQPKGLAARGLDRPGITMLLYAKCLHKKEKC
jgi:hypothetical protein